MPGYIGPYGVVALRGALCVLVFNIWGFLWVKEKVERSDWGRLALCAMFGIIINQLFFYKGLSLTTPINAALMMIVTPIMVLIVSVLVLKEKLTLNKIFGITIGMLGTACLLLISARDGFKGLMIGDLLVLTNAASWACFLITVKPLMHKYQPVTVMRIIFSLGFIVVLPVGMVELSQTRWNAMPLDAWMALGFILIFNTLVSYYYNAAVMKYVNPSLAGSYIYLQPVIAGLAAMALSLDVFTIEKVLLMTIILGGVYMVNRKNNL